MRKVSGKKGNFEIINELEWNGVSVINHKHSTAKWKDLDSSKKESSDNHISAAFFSLAEINLTMLEPLVNPSD